METESVYPSSFLCSPFPKTNRFTVATSVSRSQPQHWCFWHTYSFIPIPFQALLDSVYYPFMNTVGHTQILVMYYGLTFYACLDCNVWTRSFFEYINEHGLQCSILFWIFFVLACLTILTLFILNNSMAHFLLKPSYLHLSGIMEHWK